MAYLQSSFQPVLLISVSYTRLNMTSANLLISSFAYLSLFAPFGKTNIVEYGKLILLTKLQLFILIFLTPYFFVNFGTIFFNAHENK
jgi:hypothetical protein